MEKICLEENHRRPISGSIYLIEKMVDEFERELVCETNTTMNQIINDIPMDTFGQYLSTIGEIKKYIKYLVQKYNLHTKELYHSRIINARKAKMWEILCDTTSYGLKGYGKFPDSYAKEYDLDIEKLQNLISKL